MSVERGPGVLSDEAGSVGALRGVITALSTTPVKALGLQRREAVVLTPTGVPDNRVFFLIDARGRLVNGKRIGKLSAVRAEYDADSSRLELGFPDGTCVTGEVELQAAIETKFFSLALQAQPVRGEFSAALSHYAGQPLRLVYADPARTAIDRGRKGTVSLISQASVEQLSSVAGAAVDSRRFRMLIEVVGPRAHEEDRLVGVKARIGEALVRWSGHVGRCLVTNQNPDTGEQNLPTLELLGYRRGLDTTEPLAFGIYGEVLEPGVIRLGDEIIAVG